MELSEAEQRKLNAKMLKVMLPGLVASGTGSWYFRDDLVVLSQSWPGGVMGFMLTVVVLGGTSIGSLCGLVCMEVAPERTVSWLRMPSPVRVVALVVSLVTLFMTLVPILAAMSGRGGVDCDTSALYCYLRDEEPSVLPVIWIVYGVTTAVGLACVYFFTAREREEVDGC
ncbi:hypothetical protein [Streptomyces otsuchiensis]|uniref:hypothetical protein n=1 Tax=Streptomyces otsuchiensis TaxID=2681388 RepID=UPI00103248EA|nr:hypothetical protein [Streptomyces otsuchiensis]